jgi:hypothetical protein
MKLVFVYNAKAGLLAGMMDSVHKAVSPSTYECSLCAITYGSFTMDKSWREYLKTLPLDAVFHHRPDFKEAYPKADFSLPVILLEREGTLTSLLSAQELSAQTDVNALMQSLNAALAKEGLLSAA